MKKITKILGMCLLIPMMTGLSSCGKGSKISNEKAMQIISKMRDNSTSVTDRVTSDYVYNYYQKSKINIDSEDYSETNCKIKKNGGSFYEYRQVIRNQNNEVNKSESKTYYYIKDGKFYVQNEKGKNEINEKLFSSTINVLSIEHFAYIYANQVMANLINNFYSCYSSGDGNLVLEYSFKTPEGTFKHEYKIKNYRLKSVYLFDMTGTTKLNVTYRNVYFNIPN